MVKPFVFKALKVSEPSSSPSISITLSSEKPMNYYGIFKGSLTTENLMEEEGKGRHLLHPKHHCFRQFQSFGRDTGRRKKGRDSVCWFGVEPLKLRGFRYFYEIEEDEGMRKKGRGSIVRMP